MSNLKELKNKDIGIIGFGKEGKAAARFLKQFSKKITILDRDKNKIIPKNYKKVLGSDYLKNLNNFKVLILSPGIFPFKKEFKNFKGKILTPTQIFFENFKGKIIGISGTKGKGTVATLIYKVLKNGRYNVSLGGNIGKPLLNFLEKNPKIVVAELSSFQLQNLKKSPQIAILLDILEDHLDYHQSLNEYFEAKLNLLKFQKRDDIAIIDKNLLRKIKDIKKIGEGKKFFFDLNFSLIKNFKIKLFGSHNLKNISVVLTLAKILKIKKEILRKTIENFKPLRFHLEPIGEINGIKFINDSASTNPFSTIEAVKSFSTPKVLILGGKEKNINLNPLKKEILKNKSIKNVILFGEVSRKLFKILKNKKERYLVNSLEKAVILAKKLAQKNEIILFSPGFSSLDEFKNSKERGKIFEKLVKTL
ncbi:UDP-N-acetylmuramoyl-L-alanine--D-glutamate ligase [bacterium]|nr:UDP-N-acetylmuramoyl-L-alanine--D-glutamate ligase [bacterium]